MEEKKDYIIVEQEGSEQNTQRIPFQEDLPNATMVLTLGILSIVLGLCCCGPFALILSVIGWVMGHKGVNTYKANPTAYTSSSYSNMNIGKICSIVATVLLVLFTIWMCFSFSMAIEQAGGWEAFMEQIQEAVDNAQ